MSVANTIDKDVLETLTPEERAAIEDPEYSPDELAAMKTVAGDGTDDAEEADEPDDPNDAGDGAAGDGTDDAEEADEPDDPNDAGDGAAGDGGKGSDVVPKEGADDKGKGATVNTEAGGDNAETTDEGGKPAEFVPRYESKLPDDFDERVTALKDEKKALAQQFKDGEIDFDTFQEKQEALNQRSEELSAIRLKAEISGEMNEQTMEQKWTSSVNNFVREASKNGGIDYAKDEEKRNDLDTFVKSLAANPKNADKDFDWFLAEAHKRVKALHGVVDPVPTKKDDPKPAETTAKPAEKPSRKPPVAAAPKTLAHVPGSDGAGDLGSEFQDIDGLEGMELEMALRKMTPEQRERYARGE